VQEWIIGSSGLDWTILRPGLVTNRPATGRYRILTATEDWRFGVISRADVADFIVRQIDDRKLIQSTPLLIRMEGAQAKEKKARAVGFNHIALEVGDIEEALAFYSRLFDFQLRGKSSTSAFIDLGDQFLALQKGRIQPADDGRHFGLVVDDKDAVRRALIDAGIKPLPGPFLDFRDPWGNRIEIVVGGESCIAM